ncbi:hypothetical protein HYALB_00012367 [Hymenoscyphus albidus]|uniref:Uncharacterized protein n=1 Tax=Hymenoscyphus albidus TaxID=595503 RepID=A0A9N9LW73_9HELO|nr:hypothetical protein HYALB_00012367 [Hymenoscyphus albidus]
MTVKVKLTGSESTLRVLQKVQLGEYQCQPDNIFAICEASGSLDRDDPELTFAEDYETAVARVELAVQVGHLAPDKATYTVDYQVLQKYSSSVPTAIEVRPLRLEPNFRLQIGIMRPVGDDRWMNIKRPESHRSSSPPDRRQRSWGSVNVEGFHWPRNDLFSDQRDIQYNWRDQDDEDFRRRSMARNRVFENGRDRGRPDPGGVRRSLEDERDFLPSRLYDDLQSVIYSHEYAPWPMPPVISPALERQRIRSQFTHRRPHRIQAEGERET